MKNKKVKVRFEGVSLEYWQYHRWIDNCLVNGWMDYKDGDFSNGRDGQKYISLTAEQIKKVK